MKNTLRIEINAMEYYLAESFIFSGGEVQIRLSDNMPETLPSDDIVYIRTTLKTSDDIMELLLVHDALDRKYPNNMFSLFCDYLPYARQDRVCYNGEAFSLEVFTRLINSLGFNNVFISDVHNPEITRTLLNNMDEAEQYDYVLDCIRVFKIDTSNMVIIAPDKGAVTKASKLAEYLELPIEYATKVRDTDTGNIIATEIDVDDFDGNDLFIVDDLIDAGRTFFELAKVLRTKNCGQISLFVTHGIFSKGTEQLKTVIDHIYTTDSFYDGSDVNVNVLRIQD